MEISELRVGQLVEHKNGFIGRIIEIDSGDVVIEITEILDQFIPYEVGYEYTAMPMYVARVIEEPKPAHTLSIEIETNMDELIKETEELVRLMEQAAEKKKEDSVFECDIQGMKFKGTKSDFSTFIEGVVYMSTQMQGILK